MKQVKLTLNLSEQEIKGTLERYHFSKEDLPVLCSFFLALKPLIDSKAFYEIVSPKQKRPEQLGFVEEKHFLAAIVTLGEPLDRFQELYLEAQDILSAYVIECLSLDLLNQAYEKLAERIEAEEGLYISKYEFLGEKYPLDKTKDIFDYFSQSQVTYNEAYMLMPQKSVVFLGKLTREKKEICRHICESCRKENCANRIVVKKPEEIHPRYF
ncbi:MAG: hypothetical protein HDR01_04200 [Lachnospiraceae bacterium]|nr:hypothetical protein [Lachnospiraceae bacterium]